MQPALARMRGLNAPALPNGQNLSPKLQESQIGRPKQPGPGKMRVPNAPANPDGQNDRRNLWHHKPASQSDLARVRGHRGCLGLLITKSTSPTASSASLDSPLK